MKQYVYHFKPRGMSGETLFPLNTLKNRLPEIYAEQVKKYKGREKTLQETIPLLDCLWNDVLHISPVNPQIILDTWRKEGLYEHARVPAAIEVFKVPVELIQEERSVCFQSYNTDFKNYNPELEKFWKFKKADFKEQTQVEETQLQVWKNDHSAGRTFFWYSHTMHLLAQQSIDTRLCELIVCR